LLDNSIHRIASSFLRLKVAVWGREEAVIGSRTLFSRADPWLEPPPYGALSERIKRGLPISAQLAIHFPVGRIAELMPSAWLA
jgi:hypothetical protein